MTAIDQLLLKIVSNKTTAIEQSISNRDSKVLRSLASNINSAKFITENQSKLILKILRENSEKFSEFTEELLASLDAPTWSRPFRPVDRTKKLYISKQENDDQILVVEFAYSSSIRKLLLANSKKISGLTQGTPGRIFHCLLTEHNIVVLVELLTEHGFEIDENIQEFYKTIKSWSKDEVKNQFSLENISHQNFLKNILADIGEISTADDKIIRDRKLRYQYNIPVLEKTPENLEDFIVSRENSKIWLNKNLHSLDDVVKSVSNLKRFPLLVIFDQYDESQCLEGLQTLNKSLENAGIFDGVGIYFRLHNSDIGTQFNKLIADKQYNCQLDNHTKIVGVQNGKIPKFFLKTGWKPMSVLALNGNLRQTKTSVYASLSDLIMLYSDTQPLVEAKAQWE